MYTTSERERGNIAKEIFAINDGSTQKLASYFKCFDTLVTPHHSTNQRAATRINASSVRPNHTKFDILAAVRALKTDPDITRTRLQSIDFEPGEPEHDVPVNSAEAAIHLAVHLMLMVDISAAENYTADYNFAGVKPIKWNDDETFHVYVSRAFSQSQPQALEFEGQEGDMTAFSLQKYGQLQFVPTDNLVDHLSLDVELGEVRIFHHTSFLKAQLKLMKGETSILDCLKGGSLPPKLLIETLYSLQSLLFPSYDRNSAVVLRRLLRSGKFDPDMCDYGGVFAKDAGEFRYTYWANRLSNIYKVAKNPTPKGRMQKWLARNASDRNVLYLGIVALILSAVFGMLSVAIGAFQSWVAWQAWQHPKSPPGS